MNYIALLFFLLKGEYQKMKKKRFKNIICSLILISVGAASIFIDGDATYFVILSFIAISLLFDKENSVQ
jgi:multisubunit Na+/H+ antiporter MnhB subunit